MKNTHEILTEFAQQIAAQQRIYDCTNRGGEALDFNPAITNATKQIHQQEQDRVRKFAGGTINKIRELRGDLPHNLIQFAGSSPSAYSSLTEVNSKATPALYMAERIVCQVYEKHFGKIALAELTAH